MKIFKKWLVVTVFISIVLSIISAPAILAYKLDNPVYLLFVIPLASWIAIICIEFDSV